MATQPLRIYLRRDTVDGAKTGLLYLPHTDLAWGFAAQPFQFVNPGNQQNDIFGGDSSRTFTVGGSPVGTNINVPIGKFALTLKSEGMLQDIASTDLPPLPAQGGGNHIDPPAFNTTVLYEYGTGSTPGNPVQASTPATNCEVAALRDLVLIWLASVQVAGGTYNNAIRLGIKNWLGTTDPTLGGKYKEFILVGMDFSVSEKAGVTGGFPWSATFVVGNVIGST